MIFGIDFGTTYTVVSWVKDNHVNFINWNNEQAQEKICDNFLLPTQLNGVKNIKRLIAQDSYNLELQNSLIYNTTKEFFIKIHNQIYQQCGLSAKKDESQTEDDFALIDCVLTVPARFDDIARNAIRSAAISAGFRVLKLLTEPVAAAIGVLANENISSLDGKNGYYLVYDLGGGTFDVSLLKLEDGIFQILAIDGLANFGGMDIDEIISTGLEISLEDARKLKEKVFADVGEKASSLDKTESLEKANFLAKVEQQIKSALEKTYEIIFKILEERNLKPNEVQNLILAGGGSKIPFIKEHLQQFFAIKESDAPDLLVSMGAAKHGQWLVNHGNNENEKEKKILIDAIPFNLGIETLGDKIEILIPKNSPLPYFRSEYFYPKSKIVKINIVQGVSQRASECSSLAQLEIEANEKFMVTFMLDADGILSIQIGQQVIVISSKNYFTKPHALVQEFYDKLLAIENRTHIQERLFRYLSQALTIDISQQALDWLQAQFENLEVVSNDC